MQNQDEFTLENLNVYKVGCYFIGKKLGGGRRSQVHLAVDMTTGKKYCIKIINKSQMINKNIEKMVKREVLLMKTMKHKHIVEFIKVHENDTHLFIVLEYMEGGELFDLIQTRKGLDIRTAVSLFSQIVNALSYLHSKGIAHRDIKPENILLDKNCQQIKLIDFGYSLFSLGEKIAEYNCTDGYIPPEVSMKSPFNPFAADIYTLGILFHVMLYADIPVIVNGKAPIEKDSYGASDLLEKMLQQKPEKRIKLEDIKKHRLIRLAYESNETSENGNVELYNGPPINIPDMEIVGTLSHLFDNISQWRIVNLVKAPSNTMKEMYRMIENNCLKGSPRGRQYAKTFEEQVLNTVPTENSSSTSLIINNAKYLIDIHHYNIAEKERIDCLIDEIVDILGIEDNFYKTINEETQVKILFHHIELNDNQNMKIQLECNGCGKIVDDVVKTIGLLLRTL